MILPARIVGIGFLLVVGLKAFAGDSIRVLMSQGEKLVSLQGSGIEVFDLEAKKSYPSISNGHEHLSIEKICKSECGYQITRRSQSEEVKLFTTSQNLFVRGLRIQDDNGVLIPGWLKLQGREKIQVVGHFDLQTYLLGVLYGEMPAKWPLEALKAQAVVARTYAMYMKLQRKGQAFDVEANTNDQEFNRDIYTQLTNSKFHFLVKAIEETEGEFLVDESTKVLKTYYHSDCGGQTARANQVWGGNDPARSVGDQSCQFRRKSSWDYVIHRKELESRLRSFFSLTPNVKFLSLLPTEKSSEGRVLSVKFRFADAIREISGQKLRSLLGYQKLRSTRFVVKDQSESFEFTGRGFGHGVGLCQWGSRDRARKGNRYDSILAHYFPGTRLKSSNDFDREKSDHKYYKNLINSNMKHMY